MLGVYIGGSEAQCAEMVRANLLTNFKKIIEMWQIRNLTLKGKVIVLNALCVTILTRALCVTSLPSGVLRDFNLAINHFLWKREKGLIAHNTLIADLKDGGLKLRHFNQKTLTEAEIGQKVFRSRGHGSLEGFYEGVG